MQGVPLLEVLVLTGIKDAGVGVNQTRCAIGRTLVQIKKGLKRIGASLNAIRTDTRQDDTLNKNRQEARSIAETFD